MILRRLKLCAILFAIVVLAILVEVIGCCAGGAHASTSSPISQPAGIKGNVTDDRSFYQEIDTKDWPGDDLSEAQTLAAIRHFRDSNACHKPPEWALIGPDTFLLKGTTYLVHRRLSAPEPNVGYSRGYWGGVPFFDPIPSVDSVKRMVELYAADDCKYEHK